MDLRFTPAQEAFRAEVREWLADNLTPEFDAARGRGGPGDEHAEFELRLEWERRLGRAGWNCVGWPAEFGGRGATVIEQLIFDEECVRASAPVRVGIIGEGLLGPTLIAHGTDEQRRRFLPPIVRGEELWCQGYSEPDAGSDLANVQTKAVLDGDEWVITGQKVWTSLAHWADWCFVLCRTDASAPKHKGLSYLLVPMRQPGVEIRPIVQITGTSEFNEVFFDEARTPADHVVGEVNDGWRVAMHTLAAERGLGVLSQQLNVDRQLTHITEIARKLGADRDPVLRQRLADAWSGVRIMRWNALRAIAGDVGASVLKLHWGPLYRRIGELGVDVLGAGALVDGDLHPLFLFTRSTTIYGGSDEIQRNIIGEQELGLPRGPR